MAKHCRGGSVTGEIPVGVGGGTAVGTVRLARATGVAGRCAPTGIARGLLALCGAGYRGLTPCRHTPQQKADCSIYAEQARHNS
ncbi:hypothetical protein MNKW57_04320 [Biformimicrobium ophioploci]|uniref:Uncharacterized protein n=1 Tax=Biformimicrobium ophioploci TaxID=3036711 RepID=A0ABQ6LVJ4_9GAMM|nr:hypothetical protein MNKW57_04320 [Microbulbifer sp. NKW57]